MRGDIDLMGGPNFDRLYHKLKVLLLLSCNHVMQFINYDSVKTLWFIHGLFTNGWETRSRDVWKPVRNRTPGIISKICKLAGGTPAPVCSGLLGPYKISHGLIRGKMTPAR